MSLSERLKSRQPPDPSSGGVLSRSRSFAGLLGHRRTASAVATPTATPAFSTDGSSSLSSGGSSSSSSSTLSKGGSVLGQHHSPHAPRRILQGISSTWSGKPPRSPRPARTLLIFNAVERGLRECVGLAQEDILNLRSSVDNLSLSSSQQLKAAERYLKRVEFQLSKVEELREQYEVQQRMRDGVRTMAYAYVLSPGCEKDNALHGVRSGYRECVDTLCVLEAHLEQLMGTLQFHMKGIQGFARLCAGDNFEISVKHGEQKWKSRGRVQKNGQQVWDNQQIIVKALLGEFLFIKAVEVRGLGKNMLLGNKSCEIKELFSSHSQLMTVNLNSSGSLKLNLIITWNPLHGCLEDAMAAAKQQSPPVLGVMGSPFSRRRGTSPFRGDSILERTGSMAHELEQAREWRQHPQEWDGRRRLPPQGSPGGSLSAPGSAITSPNEEFPRAAVGQTLLVNSYMHSRPQSPTLMAVETTTSQRWSSAAGDSGSDCCSSLDLAEVGVGRASGPAPSPLREAVQGLSACLEDIQGHYPELHSLEQSIAELDRMLRRPSRSRRGSTGSEVSISVESALGCFDFLDGEETESSESSPVHQPPTYRSRETKNGGTADSGVASFKDRRSSTTGSSTPSPVMVSTGSDQLDCAITVHCRYCIRLIEGLGTFGPLRCRERASLEKLQYQAHLLHRLLRIARHFASDKRPIYGSQLLDEEDIGHLWAQMGSGDGLVTTVEWLREPLTRMVRSCLSHASHSDRVTALVLYKMLDVTKLEADTMVTVFQFHSYFAEIGGSSSIAEHLDRLEAQLKVLDSLSSGEAPIVKRTLSALKNVGPSREVLFSVSQMLVSGDRHLSSLAEHYLKSTVKSSSKMQVCSFLVEGLESDAVLTRQGCCRALSLLQAHEYMEELVHLSYADEVAKVRQQAKEALFSFGEDGRREFQQSQLVAHGFQGLTVK